MKGLRNDDTLSPLQEITDIDALPSMQVRN